jgi:D-xylose transport system substrate-binding protein
MKTFALALLATTALAGSTALVAAQDAVTIGVSWNNFQEERWKTDEAAIKAVIEAAGATYISADAQSSASKQLTDIESLISQGADALIVLAQDSSAIGPAVAAAVAEGIPVVGYDLLF